MNSGMKDRIYFGSANFRDVVLGPFAKLLNILKISPNMLTASGIILMLFFIYFVNTNIIIALLFLVLAVFTDSVDGVLARLQKNGSDRGKFVDLIGDNVKFALFAVGLVYANITEPLWVLVTLYFLVLSYIFRVILNSFSYKSDWLFRSVGGALPFSVIGLAYVLFVVFVFSGKNFFDLAFLVFSIIMIIDSAHHFVKVVKH